MTNTLDFIEFAPKAGITVKGLIVILHGWGANADDVASLFPFFNLPDYQFIFPHAPFPYPYSPTGKAWYDLKVENMYEGLTESRQLVIDWLQSLERITGVPLSRTILSGFSQGAAMTLDVGLKLPIAGLVCMSGYLHPGASDIKTKAPVLIMHGRQDEVVPVQAAIKARETLESLKVPVKYEEFDMGHEIRPIMLELFRSFVLDVLR
ncbi:MAG: alpha/beta hydrolase [Cyanomargarita calcarea GSE-NOS-MK-12-04C]|jgi:phospholipase/carboxylesterase|uniref:Alpha/beta hydrolase n=1 Tax=Cyanomargarita calcarea GSE-NOS-MK-12-04C TaxID=2839659 RepID=A0A951UUF2_9CYAN|nr:alpha/beta hydrolase [Cyanomargarita calcarea GSE-NOS-MK-12-04C]